MFEGKKDIESALMALAEQLEAEGIKKLEMVVCGGAALNILEYVQRTTKDIDVIAFVDKDKKGEKILIKASPLNPFLVSAAKRVQRDFNLPDNWLNAGPASVMDFGLPDGLMDRVEMRNYGKNLTVHFLTRYDQIHFKFYAAADRTRRDIHYQDLLDLKPTAEELEKAAHWCMSHDVSLTFKDILKDLLCELGHKDVADRL